MAPNVPVVIPPATGTVRKETETTLAGFKAGSTMGGILSEPVRSVQLPSENRYSEGVILKAVPSIELDANGRIINVPLIVKRSGILTTGSNALWTAATGKTIVLYGWSILVDPATTTVAGSLITIRDGSTDIMDLTALAIAAPAIAQSRSENYPLAGVPISGILNVNLSAAATAGGVHVQAWGIEV